MKRGRGGSRKHPADCKCGECPKMGRPKAERLTDNKVATRVLAQVKVEKLWLRIIAIEVQKIEADPTKASTGQLRETLKYLENRSLGNCTDNVNHMHDKPLEVNAVLTLGEGMRLAMEKADQRVRERK
jgi:hypothetical protein